MATIPDSIIEQWKMLFDAVYDEAINGGKNPQHYDKVKAVFG